MTRGLVTMFHKYLKLLSSARTCTRLPQEPEIRNMHVSGWPASKLSLPRITRLRAHGNSRRGINYFQTFILRCMNPMTTHSYERESTCRTV